MATVHNTQGVTGQTVNYFGPFLKGANLIMFYHNHHRYQSGKRKGKAPLELLTGQPLPGEWWERLIQQVQEAEKESDPIDRPLEPPLHLWIPPEEATEPPTRWDRSTNGAPGRPSEHDLDTQAA